MAGEAPREYAMMKYRQYFGLSWRQLMDDTPPDVFYTDLEMITIENEMERFHEKKVQAKAGK